METTFMTIHNLLPEASILYASESVVDVLGFQPAEVVGRSCFTYFHPDELRRAHTVYNRGIDMDKAAVLHYARIQNRDGLYITCECVFTVVYDVLVACTSIYRGPGDVKNARRALEAPAVRRFFKTTPRDPRYHMLEHLSSKFRAPPQPSFKEPRAALIINRFTLTLTVMFATNAVSSILGVTPEQLVDKSFYECMQENCLPEAIRCLESAKANDSIAYLRFWRRDPRREEDFDEEMREASQSSDSEDGGVGLDFDMDVDSKHPTPDGGAPDNLVAERTGNGDPSAAAAPGFPDTSHTSSGESTDLEDNAANAMFDNGHLSRSSASSSALVPNEARARRRASRSPRVAPPAPEPYEIEAVVSCTSDGLVVVLRKARPITPCIQQPIEVPRYENGLFAAPWGANPIRPHQYQPDPQYPFQHGLQAPHMPVGGPPVDELMNSIRDVAVFAWSLTGINGNIAAYGHGVPRGEAQPPGGLPIWDPYHAQPTAGFMPPENQAASRWARLSEKNDAGDENVVSYQHRRHEEFYRRPGYHHVDDLRQNRPASMSDASAPAYPYNLRPGHHQPWSPVAAPRDDTQAPWSQGPQQQTFGPFGNHRPWY